MPDDTIVRAESSEAAAGAAHGRRAPPKWIKVLVPVWGYEFTQHFLNISLPTLLAPGNVPALAKTLPTEFIFLTGRRDEPMIRQSAGYRHLSAICPIRFNLIDDIITQGNHSTTVTLAYVAAVRRVGEAMLDTCFLFLVSDYVAADGSLDSVIKLMLAGANAVQAGNFQVIAEEAVPWLERQRKEGEEALVLPPRQLMRYALTCIHPATIANTVNLPISHNSHCNRLFWRVDADTLIGRFYLMHMLCIRPEITDFVIGASCDYSFIPEMCPSGNVEVIADSDQYLMIEVQPRHHEENFLRLGSARPKQIAAGLSEWTTALHRDNARQTLVFHGADLPVSLSSAIGEADAFIAEIALSLKPKPMPHRGHPYWRGAIAAHHSEIGRRPNENDWQLMLGRRATWTTRMAGGLLNFVLGRAPHVRRWHPRWLDFEGPRNALAQFLDNPEKQLLIVSHRPTPMTNWLADKSENVRRIPVSRLARFNLDLTDEAADRFDACYLEIRDAELDRAHLLVDQLVPLLRPDAEILLASYTRQGPARSAAPGQIVSSVFLRLRVAPEDPWSHHENNADPSPSLAIAGDTTSVCPADTKPATTKEPQYARLLEVQQEAGISTLGLMTNQVWHEDPRRLAFILARYKFVAKMLSGYHAVAELGCGDAFGTRIVQQEVDTVTAYDFDPVFVRDIGRRQSAKWPLAAQVHDILERPLSLQYDAIYSLDVVEHIPTEREDTFVGNLGASLAPHGVLIIGSPSLESQAYASPQSKVGHVNCKSGHALKRLLERHFHTVFLFSMNDEVLHTGFYPMAHYLLAICSDMRR
jgi:2-polyprenyl-3-methyl-5-hydroxy-6-metoxy-1,4-benzoquinol methylase